MVRQAAAADKLRKMMRSLKLGAFLVTKPVNVRYLTGFTGTDSSSFIIY